MKCKYLKIRTKKGIKYCYCSLHKKEVGFKCKCNKIEYKTYKQLNKSQNTLKKVSKTRSTLEKHRYSIIYQDLSKCAVCGLNKGIEINEVFMGRNRNNSMKYGMCMPLCHEHHEQFHNDREMQLYYMKMFQTRFEENGSHEEFMNIFKKNYL